MAIRVLRHCNQQITDENIGIVVGYILTANSKYNPDIGNEFGFRKMYISFAIKTIKKDLKRHSKMIPSSDNLAKLYSKEKKHTFLWDDIKRFLTNVEYQAILSKYRDNKTLAHIATELKCSGENVRLILKRSCSKLKALNEYKENF